MWVVFSFTTEHTSVGLNIGVGAVCEIGDSREATQETIGYAFDIPGVMVSPHLNSGLVKGLKYCNDSYIVSLTPL